MLISCLSGVATQTWMLFAINLLNISGSLVVASLKIEVSRLVSPDDVGKCFSMLISGDAAALLLGTVLLDLVYANTVTFFAGFTLELEGGCFLVLLVLLGWVVWDVRWRKTTTPTNSLEDDKSTISLDEREKLVQ